MPDFLQFENYETGTWVVLFFVLWAFAVVWSALLSISLKKFSTKKKENVRDSGFALFAFIAGFTALGFMSKFDLSAWIFLFGWLASIAAVGYSAFAVGEVIRKRK